MKKYQLTKVTSPSIEFECMGSVIESPVLENTKKMPNFDEPVLERKILVSLLHQWQSGCLYVSLSLFLSVSLSLCLSVSFRIHFHTVKVCSVKHIILVELNK